MEFLDTFVDLFIHLDKHLDDLVGRVGLWTYGVLFLIIFMETGLVVTPFLPGDSLLFAAGAVAARDGSPLNSVYLFGLLVCAAVLGNTSNYHIGKFLGPKVFSHKARFFKMHYVERTQRFYERHGRKTIIMAQFIPIIRTFAPFVAGIGRMSYGRFISYNIFGAVLWCGICIGAGRMFGEHPLVKKNFTLVILAVIFISVLPAVISFYLERARARRAASEMQTAARSE